MPPLRMVRNHKALASHESAAILRRDEIVDLVGPKGERLVAQHMLSGANGATSSFDMHCVGKRNLNRIDIRRGK